ncbi:MAG: TetR family transcriptional regulator [Burkholderiales bacterium]|nr:TetR family transcriptional regulator [Burkholderiales bacterium]
MNQKLRTRQALVDAADQLLAEGTSPTLADVALRAMVSTATAYRYFASADALVAEVMLDRDFPSVDQVLGATGSEPSARVLAVEQAVNDALLSHEGAMRMILRNAIERSLAEGAERVHRVGRRQKLIAAALEPLADQLDPEALERLRHALALVIGPEAILAARDVCGLSPQEVRQVTRWAAEALVARALEGARRQARPARSRAAVR